MIGIILAAAGSGARYRTETPKQFLDLEGSPLYQHSLRKLSFFADELVLVVPESWLDKVRLDVEALGLCCEVRVTVGGTARQDSVLIGLKQLSPQTDIVLVHDAARPFLSTRLIRDVIDGARSVGACIPGMSPAETVKQISPESRVERTLSRDNLRLIQTPQGFRRNLLDTAVDKALRDGFQGTDEAMLVERLGHSVLVVPGDPGNYKVTWPGDLKSRSGTGRMDDSRIKVRIGIGFDFHPFDEGRTLFLGGVEIPFDQGLRGHSDADVLLHALCDSLLGAAGLRDIGFYFPDGDPRFLGIRSAELLKEVLEMISREGFSVSNVDLVLIAERPRIQPFVDEIKSNLAGLLQIQPRAIGLKATTMENRGTIGRGEGIAAQAVALLEQTSG